MKYLIGIPVLYGVAHTIEAIESSKTDHADVLIIDNNSEQGIKDYIYSHDNLKVITNDKNEFVNPAWNQILFFFLENKRYDALCIMNSDLILPDGWTNMLDAFYENFDGIPVASTVEDKKDLDAGDSTRIDLTLTDGGIAGIFICLTRKQAEIIYPIPDYIKVWFGDNWIYEILRDCGHYTYIINNLKVYHSISQNVSIVKGISEIIEQDKKEWEKHSQSNMERVVIKHTLW